jgi:ribonuclease T2
MLLKLVRPAACVVGAVVLAFAAVVVGARSHGEHDGGSAGQFDYYLLALSWSPSYCRTHPDDPEQCTKGYGFVLHGLWPQYRNGYGPQHCGASDEPDAATVARALAFMPSRGLIRHEWSTHGTCSGLDAKDYFDMADRAFAAVQVPEALRAPQHPPALDVRAIVEGFVRANPGMREAMLSVQCRDGHELSEVRVCLDRDSLAPRACGGRVRNTCRYGTLTIPAAR